MAAASFSPRSAPINWTTGPFKADTTERFIAHQDGRLVGGSAETPAPTKSTRRPFAANCWALDIAPGTSEDTALLYARMSRNATTRTEYDKGQASCHRKTWNGLRVPRTILSGTLRQPEYLSRKRPKRTLVGAIKARPSKKHLGSGEISSELSLGNYRRDARTL